MRKLTGLGDSGDVSITRILFLCSRRLFASEPLLKNILVYNVVTISWLAENEHNYVTVQYEVILFIPSTTYLSSHFGLELRK